MSAKQSTKLPLRRSSRIARKKSVAQSEQTGEKDATIDVKRKTPSLLGKETTSRKKPRVDATLQTLANKLVQKNTTNKENYGDGDNEKPVSVNPLSNSMVYFHTDNPFRKYSPQYLFDMLAHTEFTISQLIVKDRLDIDAIMDAPESIVGHLRDYLYLSVPKSQANRSFTLAQTGRYEQRVKRRNCIPNDTFENFVAELFMDFTYRMIDCAQWYLMQILCASHANLVEWSNAPTVCHDGFTRPQPITLASSTCPIADLNIFNGPRSVYFLHDYGNRLPMPDVDTLEGINQMGRHAANIVTPRHTRDLVQYSVEEYEAYKSLHSKGLFGTSYEIMETFVRTFDVSHALVCTEDSYEEWERTIGRVMTLRRNQFADSLHALGQAVDVKRLVEADFRFLLRDIQLECSRRFNHLFRLLYVWPIMHQLCPNFPFSTGNRNTSAYAGYRLFHKLKG